jgi:hypothetical protein
LCAGRFQVELSLRDVSRWLAVLLQQGAVLPVLLQMASLP